MPSVNLLPSQPTSSHADKLTRTEANLCCGVLILPYALCSRNIYVITKSLRRDMQLKNIVTKFIGGLKEYCKAKAPDNDIEAIKKCEKDFSMPPLGGNFLSDLSFIDHISPIALRLITAAALYLIDSSDHDEETKKSTTKVLKGVGAALTATAAAVNFWTFHFSSDSFKESVAAQLACFYSAVSLSYFIGPY